MFEQLPGLSLLIYTLKNKMLYLINKVMSTGPTKLSCLNVKGNIQLILT